MSASRRVALLGALALLPGALAAQARDTATVAVAPRGHALDADGAVRIWNLEGSVRVVGWTRDSVAITGRAARGLRVFSGGSRRGVKVGTEAMDGADAPAALEVRVPARARVWVKTASATVELRGLANDVEVYTVSGAVHVAGRAATVRVESLAGDVAVAGGAAWIRARTSSGALTVRGPVGDAELSSVDGALQLDGDVTQRARVESVRGRVRIAGDVARGALLDVDTNAGDVALTLGAHRPALDVLALTGRVSSRLPSGWGRVTTRGAGQALLQDGAPDGGRVQVRSFRGSIVLDAAARTPPGP